MNEQRARKILEHILRKVKSYSKEYKVTLHVFPIEEGYIGSFQFDLGEYKNIGYSGPIYVVDKITGMYYMLPSELDDEKVNEYIRRARDSFLLRFKEKIVNLFYKYTNF